MTRRKVPTRAETQAQTREALIDAAERLFFADGYHATSIATIAAEAGRTIGALYSNFDNKEALCLEVIQRGLTREIAKLMPALVAATPDSEARLGVLARWWVSSSTDTALLILGAEYLISIIRDSTQQATTAALVQRAIDSSYHFVQDLLPEGASNNPARIEEASRAVMATAAGLIIGNSSYAVTSQESARLLSNTIRLWIGWLLTDPPAAVGSII